MFRESFGRCVRMLSLVRDYVFTCCMIFFQIVAFYVYHNYSDLFLWNVLQKRIDLISINFTFYKYMNGPMKHYIHFNKDHQTLIQ